jgi:DNA-binding beta-propeller fold protein YncE
MVVGTFVCRSAAVIAALLLCACAARSGVPATPAAPPVVPFAGGVQLQQIGTKFFRPYGVAAGADATYVAAGFMRSIVRISSNGKQSLVGSGLRRPRGLAVDAAGDVFVADSGAGAVEKISRGGATVKVAGGFADPRGVAVDDAGNLYVADYGHDAVVEISHAGRTAIGSGFKEPSGVAVDPYGNVYVADSGHGVVKEVAASGTISTLPSSFLWPSDVAVRPGCRNPCVVFVTDAGGSFGTLSALGGVFALERAGKLRQIAWDDWDSPSAIAIDAAGDLYVADTGDGDVWRVKL